MAIPGITVFQQLQASLDQAREGAVLARKNCDLLDVRMKDLVAQKGAALLDLARHYLPEISRPAIEQTFAEIRGSLLEVLDRKERTHVELLARLDRFREQGRRLDEQIESITGRLNEQVRRRTVLEELVATTLKANPEFQRLTHDAAQSEARLQQNEARVNELQRSAKEKLPAYNNSSLFQYLLKRKFGTLEYTGKGWTKSCDRWVADLIDFARARQGYDFLTTMPDLMATELARRTTEWRLLMQQIEAIEDRESDAAGLTAVREEGQKLGRNRDEQVASRETSRREQQKVEAELLELDKAQGRFHDEAIQKFERFLGQTETSVLETRAKRTPEPRDDEIVRRIAELNRQIDQLKPQIAQALLDRTGADELATGAELIVGRFRQNNFDSDRSSFSPVLNVETELSRFRQRLLKPEELWQTIRRQQQFEPTQAEVFATGAARTMGEVLTDPAVSRVLVNAMVQVAGVALDVLAQSSAQRHSGERSQSHAASHRAPSGGGFTSGEGF